MNLSNPMVIPNVYLAVPLQSSVCINHSLAIALAQKGKTEEAIAHLRKALQIKPDYEEAKRNLNIMLNMQGKSS